MQTKVDRDSNGLCCDFHPLGGVVATGYSAHNTGAGKKHPQDYLYYNAFIIALCFTAGLSSANEQVRHETKETDFRLRPTS